MAIPGEEYSKPGFAHMGSSLDPNSFPWQDKEISLREWAIIEDYFLGGNLTPCHAKSRENYGIICLNDGSAKQSGDQRQNRTFQRIVPTIS